MKSDNPLSFRNILAGIIVTVVGGILVAAVIQDARFAPVAEPTPTKASRNIEPDTPLPPAPTPTQMPATATPTAPVIDATPTQLAPTQVPPTPTIDRHPGEVNLLESDKSLPAGWFTNGQYTYWEGYLHVQDEPFIDITVEDCGDDEGNRLLDTVRIFNPDGTLAEDDRNCGGNRKYRVKTYQKPGYYRIFIQDNDTGGHNGNGGTLYVDMLKDQLIYRNLP